MLVDSSYGLGARLIHYLALGSNIIPELSFMIDQTLNRPDTEFYQFNKHVFISGLARAGTTALMRLLYSTGHFCSLTYRSMPFPLAPYLWGKLVNVSSKKGELGERAHGDGILVDFDSPEALEEVFWRVFCNNQYILVDRLVPIDIDQETIQNFRRYIGGLLKANAAERYLSKNNNNILRLCYIKEAFPNAIIIIPFRDPVQQAQSLYNQHNRFIRVHSQSKFSRRYMQWLVHYEFGSDHRFFDLFGMKPQNTPDNPVYWLEQWINVYRYILEKAENLELLFVEYEKVCENPAVIWKALSSHAALPAELPTGFALRKALVHNVNLLNSHCKIISEAYSIHEELVERSKKLFDEK